MSRNGDGELTAGLALWYLHMLTRDEALPGQCGWRVCIGAPADRTRARACAEDERDSWIRAMKGVGTKEGRDAKRHRGWVWPADEYRPKVEGGRARRRKE